jgi:hypothetical protein
VIDINVWRRFSEVVLCAGGFYQWLYIYPNVLKTRQDEPKSLGNWGGCIELQYFFHHLISTAVRGSWDKWNGFRIYFSLQFEVFPAALPVYQPTRRYLMPVQYDTRAMPAKLVANSAKLHKAFSDVMEALRQGGR